MDERVNILVEAWRKTVSQGVDPKHLFLTLLFFSFIFLVVYLSVKVKKYLREKHKKRLFIDTALSLGLTEKEANLLWEYAHRLERDPFLVLEYKAPFEKVIQKYIEENPDFDEKLVKSIRKKLGFDGLPEGLPLISTKDIELYQTGNLITQTGKMYPVALYDKDEKYMYWYLIDIRPPFAFKVGEKVRIRFLRTEDGMYTFEGIVEEIIQENGKYIVKIPHTFDLERVQRRKEVRVKINKPVEIVYKTKDGNKHSIYTRLLDISAEGAKFCLKKKDAQEEQLKIGTDLTLSFELEGEKLVINATLKNIVEENDNECYGVQFQKLDKKVKDIILKFIQKEQHRMLKKIHKK
ncbi:MAG: PilZ domain-containing protein [Aquificae bacterium]|nr:PilZ domain-containing protein [Aquificota bacterium]